MSPTHTTPNESEHKTQEQETQPLVSNTRHSCIVKGATCASDLSSIRWLTSVPSAPEPGTAACVSVVESIKEPYHEQDWLKSPEHHDTHARLPQTLSM
mmetsp:Transcript_21020/g.58412  ORF Transcript_21020/g.58412 Transcript_21020/m.58412 type:complete len:98 (-) Transcript_21020:362-655(-)